MKSTINGTTTIFVGNHYEVTGSQITKYYFTGTQRIAMRKYTIPQPMTVEYLVSTGSTRRLGDHLGSTSITTDNTGARVSEMRYKPWGEVRSWWTVGLATTPAYKLPDYTFTGQFSDSYINLLWYGSRHYDPELGRFISPDTIVPTSVQGVQAYDRFAYANNNPLRYTDPTGHWACDEQDENGNCKAYTEADYKNSYLKLIKDRYKWNVKGNDWTLKELELLYQTGQDIESYVDGLTGGKGLAWMNTYLGGTTFQHGSSNQALPGWIPGLGENTIFLAAGKYGAQTIAHELGHIWDINTSEGICLCGATGGVADDLNAWIGGNITSGRFQKLRFLNWDGKSPDADIQSVNILGMLELVQFNPRVRNGYGNGSTADYLAESFSWNVRDRQKVPVAASVWVDHTIIAQASVLP